MMHWGAMLLAAIEFIGGFSMGLWWRRQNSFDKYVRRLEDARDRFLTLEMEREVREWNERAINIMIERGDLTPETADHLRMDLLRTATRRSLS